MFQGFYTLTSGVLTQTRNMNIISNNMANTTTPGFKSDRAIISGFSEVLMTKTQEDKNPQVEVIGSKYNITGIDECVTDYTQGAIEQTNSKLDFALLGEGYFCIQTDNGTVYTRNGNFTLDNEGYLSLQGIGRVLGTNGAIRLGTDEIVANSTGGLYTANGAYIDKLMVVNFANPETDLLKTDNGMFIANANAQQVNTSIGWQSLENSNADPIEQMTRMMAGQRALQSSAQVMKIYDQLMDSMVTKLGPTN